MEVYYERIRLPMIKSCIKVKQLKNHALIGLINKRFCIRYRSLKNAVNTWSTKILILKPELTTTSQIYEQHRETSLHPKGSS